MDNSRSDQDIKVAYDKADNLLDVVLLYITYIQFEI